MDDTDSNRDSEEKEQNEAPAFARRIREDRDFVERVAERDDDHGRRARGFLRLADGKCPTDDELAALGVERER